MKSCHHYNFEKNINIFSKLKREGNTLELPGPFGRVRAHDFFFFICSVPFCGGFSLHYAIISGIYLSTRGDRKVFWEELIRLI